MAAKRGDAWASVLEPNEVERRRLQVFAEVCDAGTFQHLSDLGVGAGWRCLEAGAGEGSVARWLAERVGSGGRVVATDVDPRFLDAGGAANVDVVRHDLRTDERPGEPFDLIHARAVLMHLHERDRIVERMATWLGPGGWMLLEDVFLLPEVCSPELLSRFWSAVADVSAARIGTDRVWALTQPGPMRSSGLVETGASIQIPPTFPPAGARADPSPPPVLEFTLRTLEQLAPAMAQLGLFTERDAAELSRLIGTRDPSLLSYGLGVVSAWGRRPDAPAQAAAAAGSSSVLS